MQSANLGFSNLFKLGQAYSPTLSSSDFTPGMINLQPQPTPAGGAAPQFPANANGIGGGSVPPGAAGAQSPGGQGGAPMLGGMQGNAPPPQQLDPATLAALMGGQAGGQTMGGMFPGMAAASGAAGGASQGGMLGSAGSGGNMAGMAAGLASLGSMIQGNQQKKQDAAQQLMAMSQRAAMSQPTHTPNNAAMSQLLQRYGVQGLM